MPDTAKLTCRYCAALMNHHAVKIEYGSDDTGNSAFDGVLRNVYECPECGAVEMTTAE